jgi:outer membrane protein OmpA-like peptidoglycan-associated protein
MRTLKVLTVGTLLLTVTACGMTDRRWGPCALGGAFLGGALGGVGGGLGVDMAEKSPVTKRELGAGIGAGTAGGALLGALLGHLICDPKEEAPPPPPVAQAPPPPPPPPPAKGTKIATVGSANFDFDKAEVNASGRDILDHAVKVLRDNPDLHVTVEGHTDSVGSAAYNQKLSERRAQAVKRYLVRQGIESNRISAVGYGKSRPIASNDTDEGRAQNRRAEIVAD